MGYAADLAEARKMKACLERHGVRVSIELQAGAGGSWGEHTAHQFNMSHHTATRPSQGLTPALGIVKRGRSDVPGPLANGYGGYDRIYRILTFGRANHPGAGGPVTLGGITVPYNNGRPYIWGTEFEGGYEQYTPEMRDFMDRANAGITEYWAQRRGRSVAHQLEMNLEHATWTTRKVDRIGYTRASSIRAIKAILDNPTTTGDEFDMATIEQLREIVREEVWGYRGLDYVNEKDPATQQHKLAKAHEYAHQAASRDVWAERGIDYVNDSPATQQHKLAKAHEYSRLAAIRSGEALAKVSALQATVRELAKGQGADPDAIDAAINKAVKAALADLEITLTTAKEN
ncbi:hypothetical protein LQF12_02100 [Ruania suaedae]|uniref:hypothetical protein n=1 Tax=Ruania suaedae TaxID=2897774 RepID=UPI001E4BE084|nr:hypothetical protein [Ruania suaedae]UFU03424.1 hypothetical protein LQF12_02100 [Ruania suaedae]